MSVIEINKAIETIVDSGEYLYYGEFTNSFTRETFYKIRRVAFQGKWGLNTAKQVLLLAELVSKEVEA